MAELVEHPEQMKRAQNEIDAIVGEDRLVQSESDISKLPFLQTCVKETFRVHPSPPLGPRRESTAPVKVMEYRIPKGTRVINKLHAIHRDSAMYENPDELNLDRFLEQHHHVNHLSAFDSYELVPFGLRQQMCPAYNLGNTVIHFMLANLIHTYDWSVPDAAPSTDIADIIFSSMGKVYLKNAWKLVPKLGDGVPAF